MYEANARRLPSHCRAQARQHNDAIRAFECERQRAIRFSNEDPVDRKRVEVGVQVVSELRVWLQREGPLGQVFSVVSETASM